MGFGVTHEGVAIAGKQPHTQEVLYNGYRNSR
jgi:hypothetical protein